MIDESKYKLNYVYAEDFGTGYFKYGPITLRDKPYMIQSRGLFLRDLPESIKLLVPKEVLERGVVVGDDIPKYLSSIRDAIRNLRYPLKDGIIRKEDEDSWKIIKELARYGFSQFYSDFVRRADFKGFFLVVALSALAPDYMRDRMIEIHREIDEEFGGKLLQAVTIIDQPFAVAIAEKAVTCTVIEAGHGNIQLVPISYGPIREGIVALNRGGAEANAVTREVLKDSGYGDLAKDEYVVEMVKRAVGLIPKNLDDAVKKARDDPDRFAIKVRINPLIEIELRDTAWMRFLIGEVVFNPRHDIFTSYMQQGRLVIEDTTVGDMVFYGEMDIAEALITSIRKVPVEIQDKIMSTIILSGGAFNWSVPPGLEDVAVNSVDKTRLMVSEKLPDLANKLSISIVKDPQFSVWKGAIIYGYALPNNVKWNERTKEGWYYLHQ
ncbi:actin/actin family protein [Vulcanisaeta moutnovskia 768-28]|uniref:Actin/actin family protein n=1 Tax=Vulcanisaeta moutnovskia (strain 768-28) TaxID=985053 RepID=F0QWL9_VULM7|nr:actin/actin family protein [Vulcanisaeta moutnovskia]ADY02236.1 actin/actin family protein [Vulcanisaeta moutnovskia 768-28]